MGEVVRAYVMWDSSVLERTSNFILNMTAHENLLEEFDQGSSMT